jgi:hypothetical protein
MVFIGYGFRFNGYNPAGMDQGIDLHEYSLIEARNYNFLPWFLNK